MAPKPQDLGFYGYPSNKSYCEIVDYHTSPAPYTPLCPLGWTTLNVFYTYSPVQFLGSTILGVLDQDASELLLGRCCPEPTAELVALLQAKGISYSGRKVVHSGRKRLLREREIVLKTLTSCHDVELGRVSLLARLAGDSGLHGSLLRAFGEQDAQRILAAAIFECCEGGALCRLEDWADDTSLRDADLSLSPSSMTRLLQHLGEHSDLRNDFFRAWFKASGTPKALISDTTSISSYAEKLCLAEWGHNRDGEHLPQVNLNMVYSREKRMGVCVIFCKYAERSLFRRLVARNAF